MSGRIAITGTGVVSPLGAGAEGLLERWCAGEVGIVDGIAPCREPDPAAVLSTRDRRRTARFTQLAILAAEQALEQAGWGAGLPYVAEDVGCIVGTAFGGHTAGEEQYEAFRTRPGARLSPLVLPLTMHNAPAASVAIRYGLRGPSHCVGSACAAGADALGEAVTLIRAGVVEAVLAGGTEAPLSPFALAASATMGAISRVGVSRPFDRRRDGFVVGEGAGMLVLEAERGARERGAEILGWIEGFGASNDAYHPTMPAEDGRGARRALMSAMADAARPPGELHYVNAHGTSTPLNDRSETLALKFALGDAAMRVPISSTKSVTGHTIGAAGAIEAAVTVMALRRGVAPPTVGLEEPDEELDLDYVPGVPRPLAGPDASGLRHALSNSFGFGGHNAVLWLSAPVETPHDDAR